MSKTIAHYHIEINTDAHVSLAPGGPRLSRDSGPQYKLRAVLTVDSDTPGNPHIIDNS
jgi:hypothetical protein